MTDERADTVRLVAAVKGRVQGVGFRFFARREARDRGLCGYVRNSSDLRQVEIVAEGPHAALESLAGRLRAGPPGAQVQAVTTVWHRPTGAFRDFQIRA